MTAQIILERNHLFRGLPAATIRQLAAVARFYALAPEVRRVGELGLCGERRRKREGQTQGCQLHISSFS